MTYQYLEMGIAAVRSGSMEEAGRLLRLAIKSPEVNAPSRAIAYMWLAETTPDAAQKRSYYQQAAEADPTNAELRQRVELLLAQLQPPPPPISMPEAPPRQGTPAPAPPPPTTLPGMPPPAPTTSANPYSAYAAAPTGSTPPGGSVPISGGYNAAPGPAMPNTIQPQQIPAQILAPQTGTVMDYIVTVSGGPNGAGTGFFVSQHPIVATTRYVVGGAEQVTLEFSPGRGTAGTVLRTYSDYDLALIRLDYAPSAVMPISPMPRVPDDAPLTTVGYSGQTITGAMRPTRRVMAAYWIPTDFSALPDAGGSPLFDHNNYLVGMMTRNTSRNADHYFGLHINLIRQCIDTLVTDLASARTAYCPQCGTQSRAGGLGYFFCEVCGATMPQSLSVTRYPIPQAESYYAPANAPRCPHCQAASGFHAGKCVRCGQAATV
ncbi:MAG: trypsin-like peptidase domain-containing protein [bacterium]|nr:trypsin-like peptidase domain-containing protein [bacterium]